METFKASEIKAVQKAKDFMKKHLVKSSYQVELFKDEKCGCYFCKVAPESNAQFAEHILHLALKDYKSHKLADDCSPASVNFKETSCHSKTTHERVGKYYPSKIRISTSTSLDTIEYYASSKNRGMRSHRKNVTLEKLIS